MAEKNPLPAFPITDENFVQVWNWTDEGRRRTVVRKHAQRLSGLVSNLVFFLLMCVLAYGYFLQVEGARFQAFLTRIPVLPAVWEAVAAYVPLTAWPLWQQLAVLAAALYLTVLAVLYLCAGLVKLCCRPRAEAAPQSGPIEDSRLLLARCRQLTDAQKRSCAPDNVLWNSVFLVLAVGTPAVFALLAGFTGDDALVGQLVEELGSVKLILFIVGCWFGYAVLHAPVMAAQKRLFAVRVPAELLEQAGQYALRCDPERMARREEEDRILAQAEEIRARRRKEEQELLAL